MAPAGPRRYRVRRTDLECKDVCKSRPPRWLTLSNRRGHRDSIRDGMEPPTTHRADAPRRRQHQASVGAPNLIPHRQGRSRPTLLAGFRLPGTGGALSIDRQRPKPLGKAAHEEAARPRGRASKEDKEDKKKKEKRLKQAKERSQDTRRKLEAKFPLSGRDGDSRQRSHRSPVAACKEKVIEEKVSADLIKAERLGGRGHQSQAVEKRNSCHRSHSGDGRGKK